jgi:hypothetical protein
MIIALSGRRIDAEDVKTARFPLANRGLVRERLGKLFLERSATALVASGACGADLLAMEVAGRLKFRRRMVLPFDKRRFREVSVTDRPGDWGRLFDEITAEIEAAGDLVVLQSSGSDHQGYEAAIRRILDDAQNLAGSTPDASIPILAAAVWDGKSRGSDDLTAAFMTEARRRAIPVQEVSTLT